jgi:hypothetical protein
VALFLVVAGGTAVAGGLIGADDIKDNAVRTNHIQHDAVGTKDQAAAPAVRVAALANNVPSSGGVTNATFYANVDTFDPFDMFSPSAPTVVTVPESGIYFARAYARWAIDDTETPGGLLDQGKRFVSVGASSEPPSRNVIGTSRFGAEPTNQEASAIFNLKAGDTVSMSVSQENEDATPVSVIEGYLEVAWLGPAH